MPPETAKLLYDIQHAAARINRFCAGKTFENYRDDELLRSAAERQFEIIGEARSRPIKRDRAMAERFTDFRKIAGFRNALVHGYDAIDDLTSWGIITLKLPVLVREVEALVKT
jgi:uncharacterized protein with HEPN domain